jgi:hypothetical protein
MNIPTAELKVLIDDLMHADASVFRLLGTSYEERTVVALYIASMLFHGILPKKVRKNCHIDRKLAHISRNFTEKAKAMRAFTSILCQEKEGFWRTGNTFSRSSVDLLFTEKGGSILTRRVNMPDVVITNGVPLTNPIFGYLAAERVVIISLNPYTEGDTERAPAGKLMSEYCLPQVLWEASL